MSINKTLLPEFQAWTDRHGMTQDNTQGMVTGNGVLFTAHYVFGLVATGQMTKEEGERILQVFANNMREPGLLMRDPGNHCGYQAHDDLLGVFSAEKMICPEVKDRVLSNSIYDYGRNVSPEGLDITGDPVKDAQNKKWYTIFNILTLGAIKYVWNNQNPRKFHVSAWIGRRMEVIASMQMALGKRVHPLYWVYWAVTMMLLPWEKVDKSYRDGYILRFHSAIACEGYGPITNWICGQVRKAIARDYTDFGMLMGAYFQKPEHPLVALCEGKY